ncbi:SDR family NAD(P)-dependent oxidoreductase [Herbiconiux sp. L3-i23]|uniref:SDR family NAD(P)-dependent oxidoreductase n=1 Tax=Herbiconiux sp. L3-i23 TaxID=2905871 RepID=UPI00206D409E|nr:SDR family oxidoreductase [Herbiconiux sp. L3-i23]BDI23641.1 oxidoreductase [Herbiconiux sp. L3-i23]
MDLRLQGKRAFVSGSTRGIGFAIARALLSEGAAVIINGRDPERVNGAVASLRVSVPGASVDGIAADFAHPVEVAALVESLEDVDIVVANVGIFGLAPFEEVDDAEWQRYFEVDLLSAVRLSRGLIDPMLARGWGRIILISSESGIDVPADMIHYGVMKAGLLALGNGLAKLTRGTEVTVNTVVGGPTYSDGVAGVVEQISRAQEIDADELKATLAAGNRTSLLQRFIEPNEIADLVAYLASPRSSATNGAAVRADGGVLTGML